MAGFEVKSVRSWTALLTSLLCLAGWLLTWISLGRLDDDCDVDDPCNALYRPFYWAIIQETGVLLFFLICYLLGVVNKARFALLAFLVLAAVNLEDAAEAMLLNRTGDGRVGDLETVLITSATGGGLGVRTIRISNDRVEEVVAGYIVLVGCNYLYIFILGCVDLFAELRMPANPLKGWRLTREKGPEAHPVEQA
ncbi:unnamed protein product [Ostreobium quekettii]|uniref:Uncharacterized protein n=1 Tax=Ostreobium quekettii TaxID=121088 RepID=A0A8S1J9V5_9CHLO|nr:unnamed protein product [Ostreobium quekettii]